MSETANGIEIRGFGENNILFLYDGMPMNDAYDGGMNWNAISVEDVERIEVVRGAASSLYGGHAVAAVVNMRLMVQKTHGNVASVFLKNFLTNSLWGWVTSINVPAAG